MQDIIEILRQVFRGLDRLEVRGIGNAQLLGSCGDGLSAAIRGLRKLQAEEELQLNGKPMDLDEKQRRRSRRP